MAEAAAVSQYPPPPHFYKLYKDGPTAGPLPPPPVEGEITVLGASFDPNEPLVPPIEVAPLFEAEPDGSIDAKGELLKLNQALLILFLELLGVLAEQPGAYAEAVTRVIAALQSMQHLLNALRPEQARHTLEFILQQQIEKKRAALAELRERVAAIREQLGATAGVLAAAGGDGANCAAGDRPGGSGSGALVAGGGGGTSEVPAGGAAAMDMG